ncbi:helix-turn-helix transcriptional regulator [Streptomyces sp. NPDC098781]|uniref:helix-turn-helix transcriptional regulator n=1 Tax=Streptomyces sp. NPDC098781 TaxID=3366097 RepID=UPI00382C7C3E
MDGDLGDFLRSRRGRIRPEEMGLPSYGRRRVPGLRREEVAQLAGVSVDYYVRLEQGRGQRVSDAVLDAIARVLRLDETEHAYLHTVARPRRRGPRRPEAARVRPGVQALLDSMDRTPAFVIGPCMDVLAWNSLADAMNGYGGTAPAARSIPRRVFLDPAAHADFPDWPAIAAMTVAHLRLNAGHRPDDPDLDALVTELSAKSEDFRHLWVDHQVRACVSGVKRVHHPLTGVLTLPYETMTVQPDPDQTMVVYTPEPGSDTAEKLALLGSWAATEA